MPLSVSPLNPKAEPVLYAMLARVAILVGARFGFLLTDTDVSTLATLGLAVAAAVEALITTITRMRVTPVHSSGAPVYVRKLK